MAKDAKGGGGGIPREVANSSITVVTTRSRRAPGSKSRPLGSRSNIQQGISAEDVRHMISQLEKNIALQIQSHVADTQRQLSALDRLNQYPTNWTFYSWLGGTVIALIVFVIGMMQLVGDRWENGFGLGSGLGRQLEKTDRAIEDINNKIERVFEEDAKEK